MINVLIVDDHALVRAGLRRLIEDMTDISAAGEAASGREAIAAVERLNPDVVIMDISMADMNGIEATEQLLKVRPHVYVLVLSAHSGPEFVQQAFKAGAAGYLLKAVRPDELERAIRTVAGGETYLCPEISRTVVDGYLRRSADTAGPLDALTPRQREILQLVAEGQSSKRIAAVLGLSIKTVESHRADLMERLGIHDVAGLVRFAVRTGLVGKD
jgi:DNA-binding NarL/FixJ family response regulator